MIISFILNFDVDVLCALTYFFCFVCVYLILFCKKSRNFVNFVINLFAFFIFRRFFALLISIDFNNFMFERNKYFFVTKNDFMFVVAFFAKLISNSTIIK